MKGTTSEWIIQDYLGTKILEALLRRIVGNLEEKEGKKSALNREKHILEYN